MLQMTCKNHPKAEYLTKGPGRNLHFVGSDPDFVRANLEKQAMEEGHPGLTRKGTPIADLDDELLSFLGMECPCPASDLIVVGGEADV